MRYTNDFDNEKNNDSIDLFSYSLKKEAVQYEDISSTTNPKKNGKHKRKRKKKTTVITIICILLSVILLFGGGLYLYAYSIIDKVERVPLDTQDPDELNITTNQYDSVKNIALLGIDSRKDNDSGRSDAILVLTIDKEHNKIKLTSIARDSYVEIDGKGNDKITHAYAFGKSTLAVKTLNKNYDLEITDYVTVNFFEFSRIIDYIGGVEVEVDEKEKDHLNSYIIPKLRKTGLECDSISKTGKQRLTGTQALCYSRIRKIDGDIERGNRQKEVLEAMFTEVKDTSITNLPTVAEMVLKECQTSLSTDDIMGLGIWAITSKPTIENISIPTKEMDAKGGIINGGWYYVYDLDDAKQEMRKFILEQ